MVLALALAEIPAFAEENVGTADLRDNVLEEPGKVDAAVSGNEAEVQEDAVDETSEGQESEEAATITGFVELNAMDRMYDIAYSDKPDLEELLTYFPETLEVYLEGSDTPEEIPVSWFCVGVDYEKDDYYFYQFSPQWDEEKYVLSEDLELLTDAPYIFVRLLEESISTFSVSQQSSTEQLVYEYLKNKMGLNTAAACGIMANIYSESAFKANNLENRGNIKENITDDEYTAAVDNGTYVSVDGKTFINDAYGYGLAQWTASNRKAALLAYAQSKEASIGDAAMQMEYFETELTKSYPGVLSTLRSVPNTAEGAYEAAYVFCSKFEIPANTAAASASRGNLAKDTFWKEYSAKDLIYVDNKPYNGYYLDNDDGLMYKVTEGIREIKSGTLDKGTPYYSSKSGTTKTLSRQIVYVRGSAYTGYYTCSAEKMYYVSSGTRAAKTGTVSKGTSYYSYNEGKELALPEHTVYVNGDKYNGYYMCSAGYLYDVTDGIRTLKNGTVSAGAPYYSYNDWKTLKIPRQTVYVSGKAYTGYYTCSAEKMYYVSSGTRAAKTGTVSKGTSYYSYNAGKTLTLPEHLVYVSGSLYSGYYTCSAGYLYIVSDGVRELKSGTVSAGKKCYSYNDGKYVTLSQKVYVDGKLYTGYYVDSSGNMYKVSKGTRTLLTGTLSKGTSYYSYNDGKMMTLTGSTTYSGGRPALGKVSLNSVTSTSSRSITVKWTAVAGVSGYEIQFCTTSNFAGTMGTVTKTGASTNSEVLFPMRNKFYYVRVRSYYTSGGSTRYSAWSNVKSVSVVQ